LRDDLDDEAPDGARWTLVPLLHPWRAVAGSSLLVSMRWALATSVRRTDAALLVSCRRDSGSRTTEEPPSLRGGGIAAAGAPLARGAASVR
jgi:hypothetical protein